MASQDSQDDVEEPEGEARGEMEMTKAVQRSEKQSKKALKGALKELKKPKDPKQAKSEKHTAPFQVLFNEYMGGMIAEEIQSTVLAVIR